MILDTWVLLAIMAASESRLAKNSYGNLGLGLPQTTRSFSSCRILIASFRCDSRCGPSSPACLPWHVGNRRKVLLVSVQEVFSICQMHAFKWKIQGYRCFGHQLLISAASANHQDKQAGASCSDLAIRARDDEAWLNKTLGLEVLEVIG